MKFRKASLPRMLACAALLALPIAGGCSAEAWGAKKTAKAAGYPAVAVGMTEAEVRGLMGEPRSRTNIKLEGGTPGVVLRYLGHNQLMHVTLVGGTVVGKEKF